MCLVIIGTFHHLEEGRNLGTKKAALICGYYIPHPTLFRKLSQNINNVHEKISKINTFKNLIC